MCWFCKYGSCVHCGWQFVITRVCARLWGLWTGPCSKISLIWPWEPSCISPKETSSERWTCWIKHSRYLSLPASEFLVHCILKYDEKERNNFFNLRLWRLEAAPSRTAAPDWEEPDEVAHSSPFLFSHARATSWPWSSSRTSLRPGWTWEGFGTWR